MKDQPSPADFATKMTPAVHRAAKLARLLEGSVVNTPKMGERTAVKQALTEADTRVQETILSALYEEFPTVALAAEEETPGVERFPEQGESLVIIDPIDGTLHSYLEERGPYAVIVGLALAGEMKSALVALPREDVLFRGSFGVGAETLGSGEVPERASASADGDVIFVSHNVPDSIRQALKAEGLEVVPACGGAVAVAPLIQGVRAGLRLADRSNATGISIRGRVGLVIAREAGVSILGDRGQAFPVNLDEPHWALTLAADENDQSMLQRIIGSDG
ncbi:MAG: inositol monophosphatase family protein [Myxococcota bacterium]|jgi:fructose-1,6-bisphosphatase/inositol monophosphatase family enzyme|nr:inositol monophosphatase family protein [Myxococcota bacterium]